MHQSATIKDVALKAGCGVATVSRVLNNTGSASSEMRERVVAAVKELDFQFSEVGRSLQSSTTKTIGFVVPSLANPVYADALQGAQEVLISSGYQMLLICTNYNPENELSAIRTLISKQVAGIVLTVSDAERSEGLSIIRDRRFSLVGHQAAQLRFIFGDAVRCDDGRVLLPGPSNPDGASSVVNNAHGCFCRHLSQIHGCTDV